MPCRPTWCECICGKELLKARGGCKVATPALCPIGKHVSIHVSVCQYSLDLFLTFDISCVSPIHRWILGMRLRITTAAEAPNGFRQSHMPLTTGGFFFAPWPPVPMETQLPLVERVPMRAALTMVFRITLAKKLARIGCVGNAVAATHARSRPTN